MPQRMAVSERRGRRGWLAPLFIVGALVVVDWSQPTRESDAGTNPHPREPMPEDRDPSELLSEDGHHSGWPPYSGVVDWLDEDLSEGF